MSDTQSTTVHHPPLDGLRGIAIALVLLLHYVAQALIVEPGSLGGYFSKMLRQSWVGVDIFFVLSGFLVCTIVLQNRTATNLRQVFFLRRAARILPLYLLLVLGVWVLHGVLPPNAELRLEGSLPNPDSLPYFLTFTQNFALGYASEGWFVLGGILSPTWSIAVEEHFYLFAGLLLPLLPVRRIALYAGCLLAAMAVARGLGSIFSDAPHLRYFALTWYRGDGIVVGMALAALHQQGQLPRVLGTARFARQLLLAALLLWVWLVLARDHLANRILNYTLVALTAGALVGHLLLMPKGVLASILSWRPLRWLGTRSYFVYLAHTLILVAVQHSTTTWVLSNPNVLLRALLALALVLLLAELSWRGFEQPILRRARRIPYLPATSGTHSSAGVRA